MTGLSVLMLSGCAGIDARSPGQYLLSYQASPPQDNLLTICSGYGCTFKSKVRIGEAEMSQVRRLLKPGKASPEAERAAIRNAVAFMEQQVGRVTGLSADKDHRDFMSAGDKTQADCIDEAANTTSYLMLFEQHKLLHHHDVHYPTSKGFVITGVLPHATALITDRASGRIWAVDSWIYANGEPPVVLPEQEWRRSSTRKIKAKYGHRNGEAV